MPEAEPDEPVTTDARTLRLMADVRAFAGSPCRACGRTLCGHHSVLSSLLGYRAAPRCAGCLAAEGGESVAQLGARILAWLRARDCYRTAWEYAGAREGSLDPLRPACLFAAGEVISAAPAPVRSDARAPADESYDAGDLGCGELVLELRARLAGLAPREVLLVTARDPAAPVDLPAWCGLTGHTLVAARPPEYWIRKKEPSP